jgi:uncharacterized membrane protein (UPF0127 family)
MYKTLKIIFVIVLITISVIGGYFYFRIPADYDESEYVLGINNKEISLTVASSTIDLEKGLSGVESLDENTGMLFVFDKEDKYGFWMKDMKISIDIIWLDSLKKVIYIEKNVSPDTYPKVFFPPENSLYVLELKPGFTDENNILVGNILNIFKK